jgi:hypothetical protein
MALGGAGGASCCYKRETTKGKRSWKLCARIACFSSVMKKIFKIISTGVALRASHELTTEGRGEIRSPWVGLALHTDSVNSDRRPMLSRADYESKSAALIGRDSSKSL